MSELNDYLARSAAAITAMVERGRTGEMERAANAVVAGAAAGRGVLKWLGA